MRRLLALAFALLAAPPAARAAPTALATVAEALARDVGAPAEGRRALLLDLESRAADLRAPLESALAAALAARGWSVTPHRGGGDAEARARASGEDWLLRVRAGLVPGRRELSAVGELIPAWASFFLQRHPEARALPPRLVNAAAVADPETLLLARELRAPGAPFATVRPLAQVPGRVLALAVGAAGDDGRPAIVAVTEDAVLVLGPTGDRIAERARGGEGACTGCVPVRDPAATVAVGDFGGGRIALRRAGTPRGEVLALRGGRLESAGDLEAAPLCATEGGRLFGGFEPGTSVLADRLTLLVDPAAPARSPRLLYGAACAPRPGPIAFATLGTDLAVQLLGPDLAPLAARAPRSSGEGFALDLRTGSGFALADLDGDGVAELVASSADPAGVERVRVLAPLADAPLILESPPLPGSILSGAGGDLTGDGLDDAVLGAVRSGPGPAVTELWLVSGDPREAR